MRGAHYLERTFHLSRARALAIDLGLVGSGIGNETVMSTVHLIIWILSNFESFRSRRVISWILPPIETPLNGAWRKLKMLTSPETLKRHGDWLVNLTDSPPRQKLKVPPPSVPACMPSIESTVSRVAQSSRSGPCTFITGRKKNYLGPSLGSHTLPSNFLLSLIHETILTVI